MNKSVFVLNFFSFASDLTYPWVELELNLVTNSGDGLFWEESQCSVGTTNLDDMDQNIVGTLGWNWSSTGGGGGLSSNERDGAQDREDGSLSEHFEGWLFGLLW